MTEFDSAGYYGDWEKKIMSIILEIGGNFGQSQLRKWKPGGWNLYQLTVFGQI